MKLKIVHLRNFRRLEIVTIDFEPDDTVFVGPNNSGKTSATSAFRYFLGSSRSDFTIHDFSVSNVARIDLFGAGQGDGTLPAIEMDLWFTIDRNVEFGRVSTLLPNVSSDLTEVGVRIRFCVKNSTALKKAYDSAFPPPAGGGQRKPLSHFLSLSRNLSEHFGLQYFALERAVPDPREHFIDPDEGKRVLRSLIRIDFVDAQRNIDDHEEGRANRLSAVFAAFYRKNLEQPAVNETAHKLLDQNNDSLTKHYAEHFKALMEVIQGLGVPSVNDRKLNIVSTLSPESALRGNIDLLYVDEALKHVLPESYNGLGFKNLVYMAIQISHFHLQWMATVEKRPLCQMIFIEEPEVHLHAQVQQTFIANIWKIVHKAAKAAGEEHMTPQVAVTTHSSHILEAVDFGKVRYFRRCARDGEDPGTVTTLNASRVHSLREFTPQKFSAAGDVENAETTLKFLRRYLRLAHCDLFFADAAILVEGASEKILMNSMIEKTATRLRQSYLTVLEVGGAHAHRFASLLEFLNIPYLVIADIDSVDPNDHRKVARADKAGAITANPSLKFFFNKTTVGELANLKPEEAVLADGRCCVTFQRPVVVQGYDPAKRMYGRTFEEAFVYDNMALCRNGTIDVGVTFAGVGNDEADHQLVYERVGSSSFKKTEFALDVVACEAEWVTPGYIAGGLKWLEELLHGDADGEPDA